MHSHSFYELDFIVISHFLFSTGEPPSQRAAQRNKVWECQRVSQVIVPCWKGESQIVKPVLPAFS